MLKMTNWRISHLKSDLRMEERRTPTSLKRGGLSGRGADSHRNRASILGLQLDLTMKFRSCLKLLTNSKGKSIKLD
jgi:hypothetical protein